MAAFWIMYDIDINLYIPTWTAIPYICHTKVKVTIIAKEYSFDINEVKILCFQYICTKKSIFKST